MIRLLVADGADSNIARRVAECPLARHFELVIPPSSSEQDLVAAAPPADAILTYRAAVPASVIRAAPSLRLIQKHGINCRRIDVAAATERNVRVATVPLVRNATVAEHALALVLACSRQILAGHRAVAAAVYRDTGIEPVATTERIYRGNWAGIEGIRELFGSTVGIVGMGDIGMEIAKRARSFGVHILYWQRTRHPRPVEESLELRYSTLDTLLAESDFVVLAVPHTPETTGLIGARELALMKSSATLVNVGRGGLIDEEALYDALRTGRIAMAGLDVYRYEPLPADSPLLRLANVVLTPHTGRGSYRSWKIDTAAVLTNILSFFEGQASGIVNG
jgi:phosphoglycerate dehydrogenase-like enzyme